MGTEGPRGLSEAAADTIARPGPDGPGRRRLPLAWLGVVAFTLGLLATGVTVVRGTVRRQKLALARDHALTLWSRGWYCARCNTVHCWSGPGAPAPTMSLAEFHLAVWGTTG